MAQIIAVLISLFFSLATLGLSFQELKLKDYEEMKTIVTSYVKKAKKSKSKKKQEEESQESERSSQQALSHLKAGLKILFTRPNNRQVRNSLTPLLEQEIMLHHPFLRTLRGMVADEISVLKDEEASLKLQTNALFFLENAMFYAKNMNISNKKADAIFLDIKEAKIKITEKMANYLSLEVGRGERESPSRTAKKFLKIRWEKRTEWEEEKKQVAQRKKEQLKKSKED